MGGAVTAARPILVVFVLLTLHVSARARPVRRLTALVLVAGALLPGGALAASADDPACARWRKAFAGMPTATLVIVADNGRLVRATAKLADTDEARHAGFQCATPDEIRTTVIVFNFPREILGAFHMQNVPAPLDIAFVKASGRIFSILRMEPSPTETYGPLGAYLYAIEARAGFFKDHGISQGAHVVAVEAGS
jgi:uncharacterized membrane protein (UPF0127 family)